MYKERIKNFSTLFFSNVLGQVVALSLYPYIARFYLPEDFSRFGFIVSLTIFLSIFATGQLHTAILNPNNDEEALDLVGASISMIIGLTVLVTILTTVFDRSLLIVPLYLLVHSLNDVAKMVYIRRKQFSVSAGSQISFRLISNGLKLSPILVGLRELGLILSEVLSLYVVALYAFKEKVFVIKFKKQIFRKYWKFPVIQSSTIALGLLIADFPILFWSQKYSAEFTGYYVMAQKLLITPALIFSTAVQNSTVHYYLKSNQKLRYYLLLIAGTTLIGLCGIIGNEYLGQSLFSAILGNRWSGGFEVYRCVAFLFVTKLGLLITQSVFILNNEVKTSFIFRATQLIVLIFLAQLNMSFFDALMLYVALDLLVDVLLTIKAAALIHKTMKGIK